MKKNAMLKIAAILMVAVLLTTCAISSTFAKYTATASDSATARVARWGVTADMTIDGLFSTTYAGTGKVTSSNTDNVIAPGTYDEITLSARVSGTPEVSVAVDYTADLILEGFSAYCPLVFYVNGDKVTNDDGTDCTTAAQLETAVEKAINTLDVTADPNTNLNSLDDIIIEWEWLFEVDDDADASNGIANDSKDNTLGNAGLDLTDGSFDLDDQATIELVVGVNIYQTGPAAVKA